MAKILIIDDRPLNRQFLTTLLGYQHHSLFEASDGAEGLRVAREQRPDLIISDVLMPTMDGYEFVRQLREDPEIGKTPVVFSTAHYLSRESQSLAHKCGVTSIIYKPGEPKMVLDVVAAALGGAVEPEPTPLSQPEDFDREHLQLLTNKLSENAEQLRDAHGKLTALIELSTELARERDPAELLDRYCSVAREVIGSRWTMVALLTGDRMEIQHLGTVGIDVKDTPALRKALLAGGVFATVTKEGRAVCLSDLTSTSAELQLPDSLPRAGSLMVAPLAIRGHVDGWICLADKLGFDAFSEQDEQLAAAFAAKVAVAYDNARLYSESKKYANKLEVQISERAKVDRQLGETKARLAGIIDSAMDSIITVDSDQRIVMFNKAAEKMFRCRAAEVIGKGLDRFIPPRFRPSHAHDIRRFGETGVTTRAMAATRPVSGVRSDGEEFPLEASISQIEVGGQRLYTVIMRDISEKTRALEALRSSELRYRRLFESSQDGILILDAVSGQIVDVNPFLTEMLGYSKEDLLGKELWEIGSFKDIIASRSAFDELQQQGFIRYENMPLETQGGIVKEVEFVSNSYIAGRIRVIQCNVRDISDRKRAEDLLRHSEESFRAFVMASSDVMYRMNADWSEMRELDGRNFILDTKEPRAAWLQDYIHPDDQTRVMTAINEAIRTRSTFEMEHRVWRVDGSVGWTFSRAIPLEGAKGEIVEWFGAASDVTDRKQAEGELRETNQHLEQALDELQLKTHDLTAMTQQLWQASKLATMGELAASIAHELNNPLTTVTLSVETLMTQLADDEKKITTLETVRNESERMASLVSNLLQFSRRSHAQISTLNIAEELSNSLNLIDYHLRSGNVKVVKDIAADLPTVQGDRQQLLQVFLNLLTNASDAMPQGGTVTLRIHPARLNGQPAVMIEFVDTGTGIETTDLQRIWEPFVTTKPEGKGTGLGLPICRRTIEEHRGTIEVESQPGQGTTFRILLPATETAPL